MAPKRKAPRKTVHLTKEEIVESVLKGIRLAVADYKNKRGSKWMERPSKGN
jgi:hypothetical protein